MNTIELAEIENSFREKISRQIKLIPEGTQRYRVSTPFQFDDGDHLVILFKRINNHWYFTDEGHTFMHMTYSMDEKDLYQGTRQTIISNTLNAFLVDDRNGELISEVQGNNFGDHLYSFIQALLKITDITYLNRERVHSTFMEDFKDFIIENVPNERCVFDWREPTKDPNGDYLVDLRINHMSRPLFAFGISSDNKARDVTIILHQFERWEIPFQSMAIFENQEEINRKVLARLSDVCGKQFSNLGAKDRITRYLQEIII